MKTGWLPVCEMVLCGLMFAATGGLQAASPTVPTPAMAQAMNRGVSLMGQYQYDPAARAFEEVLQAAPGSAEVKINLAIALFNRGRKESRDLERAGELLQSVLQAEPENARALYFQGVMLAHLGKSEPAIGYFEKVLRQRPEDGAAWYLLGLCQQRMGRSAESALLHAIQCRPSLYSAYYKLYQVMAISGNAEKAKPYLDKFTQLRESPLGESIELPQYNQMGELALAQPFAALPTSPVAQSAYAAGAPKEILRWPGGQSTHTASGSAILGGLAFGDFNRDGLLDAVVTVDREGQPGRLILLLGQGGGQFREATAGSGLEKVTSTLSCAVGDYDNDDIPDLFVAGSGGNFLFKGRGDGTFANVTTETGLGGSRAVSRSGLFLDADHDGDLDLFVCNAGTAEGASTIASQLWNNNSDGHFTNIAASAGVACADSRVVAVLPGDLDGDRDMDLVVLRDGQPIRVFLNDLLGKYHEADLDGLEIRGDLGGALQDFNGDGTLDLLVLGGQPAELKLFLGDGHGHFKLSEAFSESGKLVASWGPIRGFRVADLDLDGAPDIAVFGQAGHVIWNRGPRGFVVQPSVWKLAAAADLAGAEILDVTGDWVADLLTVYGGAEGRLVLVPGQLSPPSSALAVEVTGLRGRDLRTRSPASGYGVSLTARTGLREQRWVHQGLAGGLNQSALPILFGLDGTKQADYVRLLWPDGVAQVETNLNAGQRHKVAETQRKISSCPVLFAWDGQRFTFVTDFAGVGGLGYFSAPGVYAMPQALEHIKIESNQLRPRQGYYELRVTEPMEETAYVDRLELLAVDHPQNQPVFPDERLAIAGPAPTHELLVVEKPIFPQRATAPSGIDCAKELQRVDRVYAYDPPLDRRFLGFCRPHTLELDFGDQAAAFGPQDRVFLFINGSIEYPYSSTLFAAGQARVGWEPIRIERLDAPGQWQTIVADGGAPGGVGRMFTIPLTGQVGGTRCRLRLTTNFEICYDQVFLARDAGRSQVTVRSVPLVEATLRRLGFPREVSPDGRLPLVYDYDQRDLFAPFHALSGAYTRYGSVLELLRGSDDQFALVGPGDEIALRFNAAALPAVPSGQTRSFVLVSHAYCKDMDLYTGTPQTVEPLPFRAMSRYPYPATEHYPDTEATRRYRQTYNLRVPEQGLPR